MRKHHEVPTHLNVEDKVVFGLTVRQFLFMLVGSSATYSAWVELTALPSPLRLAIAAACISVTLAFALVRPGSRPLEEWVAVALVYAAVPRRCIWQPAEPDPADWRPTAGGWQELVPSLSWVDDEGGRL